MKLLIIVFLSLFFNLNLQALTHVKNPGHAGHLCYSSGGRLGERELHSEDNSIQCFEVPCEIGSSGQSYLYCRHIGNGTYLSEDEVTNHMSLSANSGGRPSRVSERPSRDDQNERPSRTTDSDRPSRDISGDEIIDGSSNRGYVTSLCQTRSGDNCVVAGEVIEQAGLFDCRCPAGYQRTVNYTCVSNYIYGKSTQEQMRLFGADSENELKSKRSCSPELIGEISVDGVDNRSANRSYVAQQCAQESGDGSIVKGNLIKHSDDLWSCDCPSGYGQSPDFNCVVSSGPDQRPSRSTANAASFSLSECRMNVKETVIICPQGRYVLIEDGIFQDARNADKIIDEIEQNYYDSEEAQGQ